MNARICAEYLRRKDDVLVLTHVRPDGDTLGGAAALVHALRSMGKTAYVLINPETTPRYAPLVCDLTAPDGFVPQCVVTIDTANTSQLPDNAQQYADKINVSIDHHPSVKQYAQIDFTDANRASCGEVVLEVIDAMNIPVTPEIATAVYVAVSTDTGCFSYDNTDGNAFTTAARCASLGADVAALNREIFRRKSRGRIAVEGYVYTNLTYCCNGRAAILTLPDNVLQEAGATEDDLENIAAIPVSIDGVDVGVTIRDLPATGQRKASVRSSPAVSSNDLAQRFGGGGHASAAGFTSDDTAENLREKIVAALTEILGA